MTDRSVAPQLKPIDDINLLPLNEYQLGNGSMVYSIPDANHDLFQLHLVFPAGKWHETKKGQANFTARMLMEGTEQHSAGAIAEMIDSLGAEISANGTHDELTIKVMGLTKHFEAVLSIVAEVLTSPTFPEEELALKKNISQQQLLVNEQKVDFLASRAFTENLFGENHPYGYKLYSEVINGIERPDLVDFHQKQIYGQPFMAFLSGKVPDHFLDILEKELGHLNPNKEAINNELQPVAPQPLQQEVLVEKKGASQSAIRIGKYLFDPMHADNDKVKILTTVLGGYFGSRLMSNIREDKGFTYGIFSTVQSYKNSSFLYLATEVGISYLDSTLIEVYKEIKRLQDERIGEDEMTLVKNYMLGSLLNGIDGPHKAINVYRDLITKGKDLASFKKFVHSIQNITAEELLLTARKYLQREHLVEVLAGPKPQEG